MKRHNGRIIAIFALYNMDISSLTMDETIEHLGKILELEHEEEYPVEIDEAYALKVVKGVIANLNIIDSIISDCLENYTLDRLSYVDRAIIRVAGYEMKVLKTPKAIVINEALDITKVYASLDNDHQVKFNNRLLDAMAKVCYE